MYNTFSIYTLFDSNVRVSEHGLAVNPVDHDPSVAVRGGDGDGVAQFHVGRLTETPQPTTKRYGSVTPQCGTCQVSGVVCHVPCVRFRCSVSGVSSPCGHVHVSL